MSPRRALSDADEQRAAEMYRQGARAVEIAETLHTTPHVVIHAVRRQGVPTRPKNTQRKFGPERQCAWCGELHNRLQAKCRKCANEYMQQYREGGSGQRLRGDEGQPSKPPPPPPGFNERDLTLCRPVG